MTIRLVALSHRKPTEQLSIEAFAPSNPWPARRGELPTATRYIMDHSYEIAKLRDDFAVMKESVLRHYGEMAALQTVLLCLIETHNDSSALLEKISRELMQIESDFLAMSQSETGLEYFQAVSKRAIEACQQALIAKAKSKQS